MKLTFFRILDALRENVELAATWSRLRRVDSGNRQLISAKGVNYPTVLPRRQWITRPSLKTSR